MKSEGLIAGGQWLMGGRKDSGVLAVLFLALIRSIEAHYTHNLPFGAAIVPVWANH